MMEHKINILHLEDSQNDSELIRTIIDDSGIEHDYYLADTKNDFIHFLATKKIAIIISDYSLPGYQGNEAFLFARQNYSHIPFIFVSGTIGEDRAIDALRNGATDYVLKDKLDRLGPAIKRALREYELETKRKQDEKSLKEKNELIETQYEKYIQINKELAFQNDEKEKRAAELIIANKELAFQNKEKEKRAGELIIANKELAHQNKLKEKRAAELIIANKELAFQNNEKEKRAVELMNAKEKAEASDRLKTAFLNNISHEIRTPLNGILGFAPFIIQSDITMEEKEEYLEMLNFSSYRLMNTVTDIMDISLIISGNMDVHPQPIDVSLLLTKVFENFQEESMKKNLELIMQFPENTDSLILNTDGELLKKAVSKLVDNSVKFTKEGSITLGFKLLNNKIEIFVKDTGVGIEKDSQTRIYENFIQENDSSTRGHEGSGLGLSIAKGMIQLLGGEIHLESTKNIGTTVFLTLPEPTATDSSQQKNATNAINATEMPLILIAEDDNASYSYLAALLKKECKTIRACNGKEAIDLCKLHPDITLILMDIKMPVTNGIEATHIIKAFRNDLPIIAVTAHAQSGDEFKIKEAGCNDYISKPINKTKFLSLIQKYLKT